MGSQSHHSIFKWKAQHIAPIPISSLGLKTANIKLN